MDFRIHERKKQNEQRYKNEDLELAREFTKKIYKEFGNLLKAVVLFGSQTRGTTSPHSDIDLLVIVDDVSIILTSEMVEAYRIITEKTLLHTSTRIHVTTMKLTSFWEYIRSGDPIGVNILREGVALIDTGFFDPLQLLLFQGRIRPSEESIWTYFTRAPRTLQNSKWHLLQATIDLYWAVIDAAHAALMRLGEVPPSPEHVADILHEKMVKKKLLHERYVHIMREFYKLTKMIVHREIKEISGEEYDRYAREAQDFVETMRAFIDQKRIAK